MLHKELRYVCIDFETTGLDPHHDEAIQVGILSFDHTGKTIDTFSSYIKPEKDSQELKDIVRVITGLDKEKLNNAPQFSEILPKIAAFFDEKTVIIGHNIQFDLAVLGQHASLPFLTSIDTFPLGQALMPFSPSYALEVLDRSLDAKAAKETVAGSHHDALYDAYATQRVFLECINRLDKVHARFPQIQNYLSRSLAPLAQIIHRDSQEEKLSSSLPILNKTYLSDKKLISDEHIEKDSLANTEKLFVGHRSLKELCKMLPKENVIYAFSQRNKVQIAKNVLHELGLTHIDTGAQRAFNSKLLSLFFQKQSFNERETYFAIKYFFHAYREDGTIDLNNPYDRKIYHALKEITTKNAIKPVELLTHEMLYDKIRNHELMPYTTIFFFDQDRWYDTHMKRAQRAFDLHYILQITDSLIYRDQLISPDQSSLRETVHTKLVIFVGIWQTEVAALLKDVSNSTVEIDNIADNTYFYKINLLIPQIDELLTQIATKASDDDLSLVQEKRATFKEILDAPCTIMTRLQGNEVHFTVKKLHTYIEYSEFEQMFDIYQTIFLSHHKKDWKPIGKDVTYSPLSVEAWPGKEKLSYDANNIYIFSNNKQTSQQLLVRLYEHKPEKHKVHGENITGGKGKNIFSIKRSSHNVIIGGYDFFLQCVAQKVNIDKVYTLCINGPLEHIISADLSYYGNNSSS